MDQNSVAVFGTLFGVIATAVATTALWHVTRILARETKRMADAAAQPQIVATIVPNLWSTIHLDINVENTGNATAFDIEVAFDPPLTNGEARGGDIPIPFQRISLLKPGQSLTSYLSEVGDYLEQSFEVSVSWRLSPNASETQRLAYWINMSDYRGVSYLGERDPNVQIAEQLKKIRDDWRAVANGSRKLKSDIYSSRDRDRESRIIEERMAARRRPVADSENNT